MNDFIILVELRKQLSGYETSLTTCNRKAAVKIRSRISILKIKLADCVSDGINAKKVYTDSNISSGDEVEVEVEVKAEIPSNSDVLKANNENNDIENTAVDNALQVEVDAEVDNSIVDRGSELLSNILAKGRPLGTVEEAWERVILAEKMRFNLNSLYGNNQDCVDIIKKGNDKDNDNSDSDRIESKRNNSTESCENKNSELSSDAGPRSCLSYKYVTYVNQNYDNSKRIAAVLKS